MSRVDQVHPELLAMANALRNRCQCDEVGDAFAKKLNSPSALEKMKVVPRYDRRRKYDRKHKGPQS